MFWPYVTAVRFFLHGSVVAGVHKSEPSEVLVSRASIALAVAVVLITGAARAQPTPPLVPPAADVETAQQRTAASFSDEEDWGLAGVALTVGGAGLGAVLGLTAALLASGPASSIDWRLSLASATLPLVLPAGLAAGARALQPRRTLLNVGLPAAGGALGAGLGIAGIIAIGTLWGPTQAGDGPAIAAIAVSTIAVATMATTASAVALAHVIEGE